MIGTYMMFTAKTASIDRKTPPGVGGAADGLGRPVGVQAGPAADEAITAPNTTS